MTIGELIECLSDFDKNSPVLMGGSDSGASYEIEDVEWKLSSNGLEYIELKSEEMRFNYDL